MPLLVLFVIASACFCKFFKGDKALPQNGSSVSLSTDLH